MCKRVIILLVIAALSSCTKKDAELKKDSQPKTDQLSEQQAAGTVKSEQAPAPIQLGDNKQNSDISTKPNNQRKRTQKANPVVNAVNDNMQQLLFNSSTTSVQPYDMDIGLLPVGSDESTHIKTSEFLSAVFKKQKYSSFIHPDYSAAVSQIVKTVQNSVDVDDFRYGDGQKYGAGYYVPFRVFTGEKSGIGFVYLSSYNDDWYVQDLLFNVDNIKKREDEPFAPSLYRWMEVY